MTSPIFTPSRFPGKYQSFSASFGFDPRLIDDVNKAVATNKYKYCAGSLNRDGCNCFLGVIADLNGTPAPDSCFMHILRVQRTPSLDIVERAHLVDAMQGELARVMEELRRIVGGVNYSYLYLANDSSPKADYNRALYRFNTLATMFGNPR